VSPNPDRVAALISKRHMAVFASMCGSISELFPRRADSLVRRRTVPLSQRRPSLGLHDRQEIPDVQVVIHISRFVSRKTACLRALGQKVHPLDIACPEIKRNQVPCHTRNQLNS
jgi:hypothetical protein